MKRFYIFVLISIALTFFAGGLYAQEAQETDVDTLENETENVDTDVNTSYYSDDSKKEETH